MRGAREARNFVSFHVGGVEYAVHVASVREVLNPGPLSAVPRAPLGVSGVTELRGEIVAVLDLRQRFGLPPAPPTKHTKWMLIDTGRSRLALVVDRVSGVFRADVGDERAPPPMLERDDLYRVLFVTRRADALVFTLDTAPFAALHDDVMGLDGVGASVSEARRQGTQPPPPMPLQTSGDRRR